METYQDLRGIAHIRDLRQDVPTLRICDIVQFHSPISGGIRRYITDKSKMLAQFDQVQHCVIIPGPEDKEWKDGRTTYYQIKSPLLPGSKSYRSFTNAGRIKSLLDQFSPDLIEVADPYQSTWAAIDWAKHKDAKVMLFYHSDYPRAWHRTIRKWTPRGVADLFQRSVDAYLRFTFNQADALLVSTHKYERYWQSRIRKPVLRIKFGFDPQKFFPSEQAGSVREELGLAADTPLVLFLGRLAREKRIPLLVESFALLKKRMPRAQLLIVGDGEEQSSLRRLAARQKLHIHWRPYATTPAEISRYYTAADVYAHPARFETFGLSVIEALACGTPVVAFHQSGLEEACKNSPLSTLVQEAHIAKFARAIEAKILEVRLSHDRNRMHEAMRVAAGMDTAINRLVNAYLTVHYGLPSWIDRPTASSQNKLQTYNADA